MKYPITLSPPCPKVHEMTPVTATALKNYTADVLDQVRNEGALAITRHNKPQAVLVTYDLYKQWFGEEDPLLADLRREYQGMLEDMQDPVQKEGAERAFHATPEELSLAAVAAAHSKQDEHDRHAY